MPHVNFKLDSDTDGVALITWDAPGRSMNVIDLGVIAELSAIVGHSIQFRVSAVGGARTWGRITSAAPAL